MAENPPVDDRQCGRCKKLLPVSAFYPNYGRRSGLAPNCKSCQVEYTRNWQREHAEAFNAYQRTYRQQWQAANPEKAKKIRRERHVAKNYGLTLEEYEQLTNQPTCAICDVEFGPDLKPCLDHCHSSGRIRGVLCTHCNFGLGYFRDDVECLRRAIDYLQV